MRTHLGRQHVRALGSGIAESADDGRVLETSTSKFPEEGISFLCSRNSSKPVSIGLLDVHRKRAGKD